MILDSVNVLVRIEISLLRYTEKGDSLDDSPNISAERICPGGESGPLFPF